MWGMGGQGLTSIDCTASMKSKFVLHKMTGVNQGRWERGHVRDRKSYGFDTDKRTGIQGPL